MSSKIQRLYRPSMAVSIAILQGLMGNVHLAQNHHLLQTGPLSFLPKKMLKKQGFKS